MARANSWIRQTTRMHIRFSGEVSSKLVHMIARSWILRYIGSFLLLSTIKLISRASPIPVSLCRANGTMDLYHPAVASYSSVHIAERAINVQKKAKLLNWVCPIEMSSQQSNPRCRTINTSHSDFISSHCISVFVTQSLLFVYFRSKQRQSKSETEAQGGREAEKKGEKIGRYLPYRRRVYGVHCHTVTNVGYIVCSPELTTARKIGFEAQTNDSALANNKWTHRKDVTCFSYLTLIATI